MSRTEARTTLALPDRGEPLADRFRATRSLTESLLEPLSEADAIIQSMEDASPAKWHAAHTTWFWETFLLRDHLPGYRLFDEVYPFLFNSYYEAEGDRIARGRRGLISRPSLAEILGWRAHVNEAMDKLLPDPAHADLIRLGIAHEEQHIELLLTDIKHGFSMNALGPAMWDAPACRQPAQCEGWLEHPGGIARIGHQSDGFAFDNEGPAHRALLEPFALSRRLVTNGEWDDFISDGGYDDHRLWLSDGWEWVKREGIAAPLYWREGEQFTHAGWRERDPDAPVAHISYFEADAFASWAGARLPTEFEWEAIARGQDHPGFDSLAGNQLNEAAPPLPAGTGELFGDCWQFTQSAYLPYPRFRPAKGAVGEYNGKFMAGQWVLKGASCATVRGHSRPSYRNFFYPQQRWQFTGLRLAQDR
ncbi:ergothioneine biosynthesis protein EgtB [Aurantiacibacter spongiae]|uniref:Ergothioneine biosynthesis protein EgtB n=1 Tax=Aurantiacibacter spongiae TaxID=2488860 RepID=A0A3N5CTQ5_9SPHN|nr:ergothioneine biosynthesis protein EgtB [Aurantiacibacter spongiae]RPF70780.1 ergothioneine biosynthesis protein EgtB [Aurantiacibacter spongiae]